MNDVLLGYLHPSSSVGATFHKCYLGAVVFDRQNNCRIGNFADVTSGPLMIPEGRNDLCRALLNSECEWLWMVDADMGFEPMALDQLLSVADPETRPIVGGLCFSNRELVPDGMNGMRCQPLPTILDWNPEAGQFQGRAHYPVNCLIRAGATGAAMLLIHRSVIEAVKAEYGEAWFNRVNDGTGARMGEDISFFTRTHALGLPLHIHTGIRTTHYKASWVAETDFWQSFLPPAATEAVDVIVPVLHRPENVERFMRTLRASTGLATAWFVCDEGDDEEIATVREHGGQVLVLPLDPSGVPGTFAEKVNFAFDVIAPATAAPWLFIVGDDVYFRPGWLDQAEDIHRRYGANVVGTNDLCNPRVARGEHATHLLIRRSYIAEQGASWDGPGVVCHEGYRHWFVDDEIVIAARQRSTFQPALGAHVEHLHPLVGKAEMDDVYERGALHREQDAKHFEARLHRFTVEEPMMATADRPEIILEGAAP